MLEGGPDPLHERDDGFGGGDRIGLGGLANFGDRFLEALAGEP